MYIMDLTTKNQSKSRQYKITRYVNIENETKGKYDKIVKLYIEVTLTRFITENIKDFLDLIKNKNIDGARLLNKMSEVAIKESFYILR